MANVASPGTVLNIRHDSRVCVSFIDVLKRKGYKVRGTARILTQTDQHSVQQKARQTKLIGEFFPVLAVTEVEPAEVEEILAPSYHRFPDISRREMIRQRWRSIGAPNTRRNKLSFLIHATMACVIADLRRIGCSLFAAACRGDELPTAEAGAIADCGGCRTEQEAKLLQPVFRVQIIARGRVLLAST